MESRQCISLATCALSAINVTTGLLGLSDHAIGFLRRGTKSFRTSAGSERDCSVLAAYAKGFSSAEQQLLFGHPAIAGTFTDTSAHCTAPSRSKQALTGPLQGAFSEGSGGSAGLQLAGVPWARDAVGNSADMGRSAADSVCLPGRACQWQ